MRFAHPSGVGVLPTKCSVQPPPEEFLGNPAVDPITEKVVLLVEVVDPMLIAVELAVLVPVD